MEETTPTEISGGHSPDPIREPSTEAPTHEKAAPTAAVDKKAELLALFNQPLGFAKDLPPKERASLFRMVVSYQIECHPSLMVPFNDGKNAIFKVSPCLGEYPVIPLYSLDLQRTVDDRHSDIIRNSASETCFQNPIIVIPALMAYAMGRKVYKEDEDGEQVEVTDIDELLNAISSIDGHHRVKAFKAMALSSKISLFAVYATVKGDFDIAKILMAVNSASKPWNGEEYLLGAYVKTGNPILEKVKVLVANGYNYTAAWENVTGECRETKIDKLVKVINGEDKLDSTLSDQANKYAPIHDALVKKFGEESNAPQKSKQCIEPINKRWTKKEESTKELVAFINQIDAGKITEKVQNSKGKWITPTATKMGERIQAAMNEYFNSKD
ncbi:MAG: hypothetical protein LIP03_14650 [Bacteroidales bacterium]|nr:hypothetical protein [Bacteroidales bacterium]